jgi:hypothetical protein
MPLADAFSLTLQRMPLAGCVQPDAQPDAFSPDAFSPDAFSPDAFSPDAFSGCASLTLSGRLQRTPSPTPSVRCLQRCAKPQLAGGFSLRVPTSEGIRVNTWDQTGDLSVCAWTKRQLQSDQSANYPFH